MSASTTKAAKRAKFEAVFTVIRNELVDYFKAQGMPKDAVDWFQNVCYSCTPHP